MTFQLLGKPVHTGRLVRRLDKARVEAVVERTARGYVLEGTVSGRPGRLEVFRTAAPPVFLLNNWQSWGPMERVTPSTWFPELEAIVRDYSPYLFSPLPEFLGGGQAGESAFGVNLADRETVIAGAPVAPRSGVFLDKRWG